MDAWLYAVVDGEIWNKKIKYNIKTLNWSYSKLEPFVIPLFLIQFL